MKLDRIIVEKYRLTCTKCGYTWYSATKATEQVGCGRCRAYVRVPDELRAQNASRRLD